jgi:hypothetical protein
MRNFHPLQSGPPATARSGAGRKAGMTLPSLPGAPTLQRPAAVYPAIPEDTNSRYIEAALGGIIVGCLYLPNGNPAPGPKSDYKLRWFECLAKHAKTLLDSGAPVVLAGDFNLMPTDLDVYDRNAGSMKLLVKERLVHKSGTAIGIECSKSSVTTGLTLKRIEKGSLLSEKIGVVSSNAAPEISKIPHQRCNLTK